VVIGPNEVQPEDEERGRRLLQDGEEPK